VTRIAAIILLFISCPHFVAAQQTVSVTAIGSPAVVLKRLSEPICPPLARTARITGDVRLAILIDASGSIRSLRVIEGHPILVQAALESARQTTFECRGCSESIEHEIVFKFRFEGEGNCDIPSVQHPSSVCSASAERKTETDICVESAPPPIVVVNVDPAIYYHVRS
jgi:TonB family protein